MKVIINFVKLGLFGLAPPADVTITLSHEDFKNLLKMAHGDPAMSSASPVLKYFCLRIHLIQLLAIQVLQIKQGPPIKATDQ